MTVGIGTRFVVIKGGGEFGLERGEIWDLVDGGHGCGMQFRKMNKFGGSLRLLNGYQIARQGMDERRLEIIK